MLSAHRLPWLFLLLLYYFVLTLIERVPLIGPLAVPVLKPVFAVGFLAAAWAQERGEIPRPRHLFQGFRANLWVLLPLGSVFLVGVSVAVLATALVDDGLLLDVLSGKVALDDPALATGRTQVAMLFGALCALPVLLALWFAPALVVFHECRTLRALSTSLSAALANWRPIGVYALLVFFYGAVLPGTAVTLISALLPKSFAWPLALLVVMPYLFLFVATLHISDYVCYRDIFHANESPSADTATAHSTPPSPPAA